MVENKNIEFKQDYTDKIYNEIVAFLNTCNGTIYVGYDDKGNLVGLKDSKRIEELISNEIVNKIVPDCRMLISINNRKLSNKNYITIDVIKGKDIYYLKSKGQLNGTYIRSGSCSVHATDEVVKQMIINNNNLSFETFPSNNQDLTFDYATKVFKGINVDLKDKNILRNLNFIDNQGNYTNIALLMSDQNPFTIKAAVYETPAKMYFRDREEFRGSLLEIYDTTLKYLHLNSATYGTIKGTIREDVEEYPDFVLREILLNSLIHRDYSTLTSNIINIYKDYNIEFISCGSLFGNATLEDIMSGFSTSRNPVLQSIFMRLHYVEAIGSGLKKVKSYYDDMLLEFKVKALPASFIVQIPRIEMDFVNATPAQEKVLKTLGFNETMTRQELQKVVGGGKTSLVNTLNELINKGFIRKIGKGPSTIYERR